MQGKANEEEANEGIFFLLLLLVGKGEVQKRRKKKWKNIRGYVMK